MQVSHPMSRLVELASRIRSVRQAQRQFLTMWALDGVRDQLLLQTDDRTRDALDDPYNRDWSMLYRGNILDD